MSPAGQPASGFERYVVEPRSPDAQGMAALARLAAQVQAVPGATATPPPAVPGLVRSSPRLLVSLPPAEAAAMKAEHDGTLIFDPEAELRY